MTTTILDVLHAQLGDLNALDVHALDNRNLEALAIAVNESYSNWAPPAPAGETFRLCSGGWIAGNAVSRQTRQYLHTSLLYAPSVVIHDPIADWFDASRERVRGLPAIRSRGNRLSVVSSEPDVRRTDAYYRHATDIERTRSGLLILRLASAAGPRTSGRVVRPASGGVASALRTSSICGCPGHRDRVS